MARTKEQAREYMRTYRRGKRAARLGAAPDAPASSGAGARVPLSVAEAVELELGMMSNADRFPALREAARVLAQCLDDPLERRHHPTAAGQLRALLAEVRTAQGVEGRSSLRAIRSEVAS